MNSDHKLSLQYHGLKLKVTTKKSFKSKSTFGYDGVTSPPTMKNHKTGQNVGGESSQSPEDGQHNTALHQREGGL